MREGELVAADDPEITLARMHESEERAEYPAAARRAGRSGTVLVKALVDESGRVLEAEAFRGDAVFYDSAVTWLRKRTFDPATKRGVRVRVWMVIPVEFRLSD